MAEDWQAIAAEVAGALGDVGYGATLVRHTWIGPDHDRQPGPDQLIPVKLLGDTLALGLVNGTSIRASDRREMMAAAGTTPTPADHLRIGTTSYAIIRCEPFAPGGIALYYDLILRA
ncbi:hypothetical protein [Paracoccus sp. S4493]|uniref:hypothetical protein n=1 Tax=Paracoccus sp. S4493 TaxID=579490 RepID=UPI000AAD4C13|nr:hypothetical protein [Paracoccus sp. S4493]